MFGNRPRGTAHTDPHAGKTRCALPSSTFIAQPFLKASSMLLLPTERPRQPRPCLKPRSGTGRGFTVVEVFAVIALVAATFALLVVNVDFSTSRWSVRPPRESMIRAIGEAHNQSRLRKEDMFLRYDEADSSIRIENAKGENIMRIHLPGGQVNAMTFYRILPETERSESLTLEPEEEAVQTIAFSPSGSSTPMLIEIDTDAGRNSLIFDPFSLRLIQDAQD